jgi:ATP-dependent metalloprotease
VPFFFRAGSEFEEMFVGVGSRRVRALFAAAKKKAPCIVFIDEIDAIGGSRKAWESNSRKTLNQLLVEMDGFEANDGVIVLAATNLPETLDGALTRPGRFDRHVHVPNPDIGGRRQILAHYLKDKPLSPDVDVGVLARGTSGFSGADLANLVNTAAIQAALTGADRVTAAQLDWARDRVLMGHERKSAVLSEECRKLTAFHEGGHALVALRTDGAMPLHKATIMPRGASLGMVQQLPDKDETSVSLRQMRARLDVCMGGRVAEELVFGADAVTSGARSDLQQATSLARHMVTECGMSDIIGPLYCADNGAGRFKPSPDTERVVDDEVRRMLRDSMERVRALLGGALPDLHAIAGALLERETLTGDEVRAVLAGGMGTPGGTGTHTVAQPGHAAAAEAGAMAGAPAAASAPAASLPRAAA